MAVRKSEEIYNEIIAILNKDLGPEKERENPFFKE